MTLSPAGKRGNYFSQQTRTSSRFEWRETWSLSRNAWGTHNLKFGSLVGGTAEHGADPGSPRQYCGRRRPAARNHHFHAGPAIRPHRRRVRLLRAGSVDYGHALLAHLRRARRAAGSHRRIPRRPPRRLVWTPFAGGRTIVRGGIGVFFDRVPLNVYGFAFYPDEIITLYTPDGSIV